MIDMHIWPARVPTSGDFFAETLRSFIFQQEPDKVEILKKGDITVVDGSCVVKNDS